VSRVHLGVAGRVHCERGRPTGERGRSSGFDGQASYVKRESGGRAGGRCPTTRSIGILLLWGMLLVWMKITL
jgi:hypothetical protein